MASMMYHSMVPIVNMPITALPPSPAATSRAGTSAIATLPLYLKGPGAKRTPEPLLEDIASCDQSQQLLAVPARRQLTGLGLQAAGMEVVAASG
jgi:hypothetical protein